MQKGYLMSQKRYTWKELRQVYEQWAVEYVATISPKGKRKSRKYQGVIKYLNFEPGSIVLDAGCGKGPYTTYLSKHNISLLISTDISNTIIMEARKQSSTATDGNIKRVRFVVSNIEHLPLKDGVFDAVVCSQVIEHLLDDRKGLNELYRVLKPNARLVISTDNKNNNITNKNN